MLTQQLAQFVFETESLPADVERAAKIALMDTLGCALAGVAEPAARNAREHVQDIGAKATASIWGTQLASSPAEAAFANAIATHVLDFDDTLATLRGHASATTLPVALAIGEQTGASGREVLLAYAIGIELGGKLGRIFGDTHYIKGWHNTATVGIFAATAVACRLLGQDSRVLRNAWGIAAAECGGILRNFGTMAKSFQAGHAARSAIVAADLARRGFTAQESIFDGDHSFQRLYGSEVNAAPIAAKLGKPWDLVEPGMNYKRWPCCYCTHRSLGGLIDMMAREKLAAEDIEEVRIGFAPGSDEPLVYDDPQTGLEGKFSALYPVAALLLDGRVDLASFTDEAVRRPAARALMKKIKRYVVDDDEIYSGTVGYTDLSVRTRSGELKERIDRGPGSPKWPISERDHRKKFLDCARAVLPDARAQALLRVVSTLETAPDVRELTAAASG